MSEQDARRAAMAMLVAVAAVVAWESLKTRGVPVPNFKTTVALVILAAVTFVGVDLIPEIAGPFALLAGLAIVLSRFPKSGSGSFLSTYTPAPAAPTPQGSNGKTPTPPIVGALA